MAKSRGGKTDLADDLERLIESEAYEPTGGLIDQFLYKAVFNRAKAKDNAIKALAKQINTQGTEQEKQKAHDAIVRRLREQALKNITEKDKKELAELNKQIRIHERQLEDYKDEQKKRNEIFKLNEQNLKAQIANAKKAGEATDKLEQQLKDLQDDNKKIDSAANEAILQAQKDLQKYKSQTGGVYSKYQQNYELELKKLGVDMTRMSSKDMILNEHGSSVDLAHADSLAKLNYLNGEINSFANTKGFGGRGSLDMDLGDDEPIIRTRPQQKQAQQERRPSPQEMSSLYNTDLGDLSAGIVSAVPDKMQQNLNQNIRDEELKHRTERESLTDQYREQVLENLKQQTYQITTIQENLHAIYDNMGQGGSGGGLLGDMLSSLAGGALATKGMGLVKGGLGLAKGALTKIPVLGSVLGAGIGAGAGALDTEAIMAQKGLTDPSQIGLGARIQRGGAGLISGALNALSFGLADKVFGINTENLTEGFDRWGNILSGNGNRTDAEVRAMQDSQTSIDADEAEMNALLASRGIIQTADGSYQIKDNSIHGQILEKMGIETAKVQQEQELAELNEGMGGVMNSSISNVTNNSTTNIIPESPRFRVNDTATMALSAQGL